MSHRSSPDAQIEAVVGIAARCIEASSDADGAEAVARDIVAALVAEGWHLAAPRAASVRRRGGVPPNAEYLAAKEAAFGKRPESEAS